MKMNYNILIVDDVLDNIQVAMNMLKEDNYELSFATSGEMALELLKENSFDLVLLDVMMPGIDGFEVCSKLKMIPSYAEVPVIFLTAKTDVDSIARAFEVGGVDYILKPFHINELLARVSTHLELYKAKMLLIPLLLPLAVVTLVGKWTPSSRHLHFIASAIESCEAG